MPMGPSSNAATHFQNHVVLGAPDTSSGSTGRPTRLLEQLNAVSYANAGNNTYTTGDMLGGIILRDCNGGARSDTTPTATQLRDALSGGSPSGKFPKLQVGSSFYIMIRNTTGTAQTLTILAGSGVTISGTATIAQNNSKDFLLVFTNVTNSPAITMYSLGTAVF